MDLNNSKYEHENKADSVGEGEGGRKLERRNTFASEDILRLIRENDLSDYNTFLVLNGGTGVGKTSSVMREVQLELEKKLRQPQSMLVVESRSATVLQLHTNYTDAIERINGIDVCQRLAFMHLIEKKKVNYDWVVIDECHGLFSEASFAEDAGRIASWIRDVRANVHIIFITANDEYFDELSRRYFPGNFNFIYLFPDFTHYVSHTYVKEIQFIKTTKVDDAITVLLNKLQHQKGIIFLKRASDVKDWFFRMLSAGIRVGMIVSQANETAATLTTVQEKQAQNAALNISGGRAGLTMADLCELYDTVRAQQGKEGIRAALAYERLPDDIDVLLATDTIQEGISIKTPIQYIIIEGFTEVEVRQKLGRFRGNLDLLYIIFNPVSARRQTYDKMQIFTQLLELYKNGNQTALAEFYGRQKASKSTISFLIKTYDSETGISIYKPNMPALYNCENEFHLYNRLVNDTENTVRLTYSYPLLEGAPKILNYNEDIRDFNIGEAVKKIAEKWRGIPLKGRAQEEVVEDFQEAGITDSTRHAVDTFRKCCIQFVNYGIEFKDKKASKKDLKEWPQYLEKLREEFKYIV